jgi:hypothetical protein
MRSAGILHETPPTPEAPPPPKRSHRIEATKTTARCLSADEEDLPWAK